MSLLQLNTKHRVGVGTVVQTVMIFQNESGSAQGTLSGSITGVVAGHTILVFMGNYNTSTTSACSDGQGSYTTDKDSAFVAGLFRLYSFSLPNANSGSHSISVTNCGMYPTAYAVEISAPTTNSFDTGNAAHSGFTTATDGWSSGSFTTSQGNDLIFGFCFSNGGLPSAGTGYTSLISSNVTIPSRLEYKVGVTATGYTATFTNSGTAGTCMGVSYKHP